MPRVSHVQEETIISDRVHCVQCITQSRPVTDGRIRWGARGNGGGCDGGSAGDGGRRSPRNLLPRIICPRFRAG